MNEAELRAFVIACEHSNTPLDRNLVAALMRLEEIKCLQANDRDKQIVSSLEIAAKAARASKQSARWTMIAAIVAAASTLISLYSVLHSQH